MVRRESELNMEVPVADAKPDFWTGGSGQQYGFFLYPLPYACNPNQDGNYIFVRHDGVKWLAVYIGQGDMQDRIAAGQKDACIKSKATHIYVRLTPGGEAVRKQIESDLLAANPEAYVPTGCNVKVGG